MHFTALVRSRQKEPFWLLILPSKPHWSCKSISLVAALFVSSSKPLFGRICSVWLDSTGKNGGVEKRQWERREERDGQALEDTEKEEEQILERVGEKMCRVPFLTTWVALKIWQGLKRGSNKEEEDIMGQVAEEWGKEQKRGEMRRGRGERTG